MPNRGLFSLLGPLKALSLCLAHDLWLEKREGKMVLYYGHLEPKPGEEKFIKYKTENVLKALCFNKEGNGMKVAIKEDYPFSFPMACSAYYVLFFHRLLDQRSARS